MEPLSLLDRLLLLAAIGGTLAALAFYAARLWKAPFVRIARAAPATQALALALLAAATAIGGNKGGTNEPPARAGTGPALPSRSLPAWFSGLGYPALDENESGIPDCWEKWTHTAGMPSDADPDGDGLANLAEFEAQTDPIRPDTDGDGIDDATELAGLAANVADLDPTVPASFAANEPDADGDGVPDLWENADVSLFGGVGLDGFLLGLDVPEPAATNFDVRISVTTSRHAALSWGPCWDESVLLPPCTNLPVRLRLSADVDRRVSLSPHPPGTSATGLWKAELAADWSVPREQNTEGNRIRTGNGTIVDAEPGDSRFAGVLSGTLPPPTREAGPARGTGPSDETGWWFRRKSIQLSGTGFCALHGPAPVVQASGTNVGPPYIWAEDGFETVLDDSSYFARRLLADGSYEVSCRSPDGHERLRVESAIRCEPWRCRPGETNLVGAGRTSTHNPTNAADHAPGVSTNDVVFGPNCPVAHDMTVRLGWTHDPLVLHIRNLAWLQSGDASYDRADHCVGIEWSRSGSVALTDFLDPTTQLFLDRLQFVVNSRVKTSPIPVGSRPETLYPTEWIVELRLAGSTEPLDTLIICLFNPAEDSGFTAWKTEYANTTWTLTLPSPPRTIPGSETTFWYAPGTPGAFMHHDAVHDMRSKPVAGGHGHQATYDAGGFLVTNGTIAAGTADYVSPESMWNGTQQSHREKDVKPYLWALHLDGNPGKPDNLTGFMTGTVPSRLSRPCIFQGTEIGGYIQRRPSYPTGIQEDE